MQKITGTLFLLIGPSAVGKTTLAKALLAHPACANLKLVLSYTTRQPRPEERDGVDYNFITQADFDQKLTEGFFIESSTAYKYSYGVAYNELVGTLNKGSNVLIVVDRAGTRNIIRQLSGAIVINIVPPSIEVLRERLLARPTSQPQDIDFRLKKAAEELAEESQERLATYTIVNDDLEDVLKRLTTLVCGLKN